MSNDYNTVYIVDDDSAICDSMLEILNASGLHAVAFESAEEFLASFAPEQAGCVVLDICMPTIDGLELCERIRNEYGDIPVIMVTGHGDVTSARRCFKMGVFDFIEKPFVNKHLLTNILKAIDEGKTARLRKKRWAQITSCITLLSEREPQDWK